MSENRWIVLNEGKGNKIKLVSKSNVPGILPKGSYLTIKSGKSKFILRVDSTEQNATFQPSPMLVDIDLKPLAQDQGSQNIVTAYRVKDVSDRKDGLVDYIPILAEARRSNQEEIDLAMSTEEKGPRVFPATVHANRNQLLMDDEQNFITTRLPEEMFFHQMMICGKTGQGKTVALKYLAQYFIEKMGGAVLAVNVKDQDFLRMEQKSEVKKQSILDEWKSLGEKARGIGDQGGDFVVYHPSNAEIPAGVGVNDKICEPITLDVESIEPEALTGLLQNITDIAAQSLPNIFRYWKERVDGEKTFWEFTTYFSAKVDEGRNFGTMNSKREEGQQILPYGTCENIRRNLDNSSEFFDNHDAKILKAKHILQEGQMSVVDVASKENSIQFGSILLRQLLKEIVDAKNKGNDVPILIIIDEVHRFYSSEGGKSSREALGALDTICRTGRSRKMGVIFASQTAKDIPRGLGSVINTQLFFKTDVQSTKEFGIKVTAEEIQGLGKGFAIGTVHEMPELKLMKFPLACSGVFE